MSWPSLLQTLLLGDNATRSQAELDYNDRKQRNPSEVGCFSRCDTCNPTLTNRFSMKLCNKQVIVQLASIVHLHADVAVRALAAVLLRGIILREKEVWDGIDQQARAQGKSMWNYSCIIM